MEEILKCGCWIKLTPEGTIFYVIQCSEGTQTKKSCGLKARLAAAREERG